MCREIYHDCPFCPRVVNYCRKKCDNVKARRPCPGVEDDVKPRICDFCAKDCDEELVKRENHSLALSHERARRRQDKKEGSSQGLLTSAEKQPASTYRRGTVLAAHLRPPRDPSPAPPRRQEDPAEAGADDPYRWDRRPHPWDPRAPTPKAPTPPRELIPPPAPRPAPAVLATGRAQEPTPHPWSRIPDEAPFRCPECWAPFQTEQDLTYHYTLYHVR